MENDDDRLRRVKKSVRWILELGMPKFSAEAGRQLYAQKCVDTALFARIDPGEAKALVARAEQGDEIADRSIILAAHGYASIGEPTPLVLADYLFKRDSGPSRPTRRGPKSHGTFFRDDFIRHAAKIAMIAGYHLNRNEATDDPSAASIVANVLQDLGVDLSERMVGEIVEKGSIKAQNADTATGSA